MAIAPNMSELTTWNKHEKWQWSEIDDRTKAKLYTVDHIKLIVPASRIVNTPHIVAHTSHNTFTTWIGRIGLPGRMRESKRFYQMQTHTNTFSVISLLLLLAIIWVNVTYIHIPLRNELKLFDRPTWMDQMQASVTNHTNNYTRKPIGMDGVGTLVCFLLHTADNSRAKHLLKPH